jgi:hypothetical protein
MGDGATNDGVTDGCPPAPVTTTWT